MRIRLRLLDTPVEIRTADEDAGRLVALLWSRMASDDGGKPVQTYVLGRDASGQWIATTGDDVEAIHASLLGVLDALRYRMLELFEERLQGYVTLHAAAVARGDDLVLLAGESGAGKTTLTLALLDAGWSYFSDDIAPISLDTGLVHPFPKPLGMKDPAAWDAVRGAFAGLPGVERPDGSFLVPPAAWDVATRPLPPGALVFTRFSNGAPLEVETLSPGKAAALASAYVRRLEPATVALLNRLCSRARCVRITHGSSDDAMAAIQRVLNRRE